MRFVVASTLEHITFLILAICFITQTVFPQTPQSSKKSAQLSFVVVDKENNFIRDLRKEEISLLIDDKEQIIDSFELKTSSVIYMLAIDNSGSMRTAFGEIINAAKVITGQNNGKDLAALMRFISADKIQTTDKFSSDEKYLHSNLNLFYVEGGQTALIDAIFQSVQLVSEQKSAGDDYHRAVVIISDGEDRDSQNSEDQLIKLLQRVKVPVIFVGLLEELEKQEGFVYKSPRKKALAFVERVTKESGGIAILPKKNKELTKLTKTIGALLRERYILKFPIQESVKANPKIELRLNKISNRKNLKFYFSGAL